MRWICSWAEGASGAFAPIRISERALNNLGGLGVSPEHRAFFCRRSDLLGTGQTELLVRARDLVEDRTVTVEHGGFVDYSQLLFDAHQIIFAEGIASDSQLVTESTAQLLDCRQSCELPNAPRGAHDLTGLEVQGTLVDRPETVSLLCEGSRR